MSTRFDIKTGLYAYVKAPEEVKQISFDFALPANGLEIDSLVSVDITSRQLVPGSSLPSVSDELIGLDRYAMFRVTGGTLFEDYLMTVLVEDIEANRHQLQGILQIRRIV